MKEHFFGLAEALARDLRADETLLCNLCAERSEFVRFNAGRVRQAGSVQQRSLALRLLRGQRQAAATLEIAGRRGDLARSRTMLSRLRAVLAGIPEDPWLLIAEEPSSTQSERRGTLPPAEALVRQVVDAPEARELVGLYAGGTLCRGFANSLGQRNWHEADSFNFDWSLHRDAGAVKARYAGFDWSGSRFAEKLEAAARELALLGLPPRAIGPGQYRAYLSPLAMEELMAVLGWGGFSARAHATRQTPLLRMAHGEPLSAKLTLAENTGEGFGPCFQGEGFVKPPSVALVAGGRLAGTLVSPRSAKEYGLPANAADADESPESLDMAPGTLASGEVLAALDTGLYVGNLWYLNFSDRAAGRITGMTRFATFWVENGRIAAPVGAMRFDDSIYRMLGENLLELTRERDLLLDPSTYGERSTGSARLPGALLAGLKFTL